MSDRAALLASVLADPADDAPRLILADWLDEHGECERAEFIRVQCQRPEATRFSLVISNVYGMGDEWKEGPPYPTLGQEPQASFRHLPGTAAMFRDWAKLPFGSSLVYSRGFVSKIACTAADWLQHAPAIVREHPVLKVSLTSVHPVSIRELESHGSFDAAFGASLSKKWPKIEFDWPKQGV